MTYLVSSLDFQKEYFWFVYGLAQRDDFKLIFSK